MRCSTRSSYLALPCWQRAFVTVSRAPTLVLVFVVMTLTQGCAGAGTPASGATLPGPDHGGFLPSRCERQRPDGLYETLVPSVIERLGTRYVLSVTCDGMHRIYLKPSSPIDFEPLIGQEVCPRYRYVQQIISPAPCLRPPCPDAIEMVLDIVDVRAPSASGCLTP